MNIHNLAPRVSLLPALLEREKYISYLSPWKSWKMLDPGNEVGICTDSKITNSTAANQTTEAVAWMPEVLFFLLAKSGEPAKA